MCRVSVCLVWEASMAEHEELDKIYATGIVTLLPLYNR